MFDLMEVHGGGYGDAGMFAASAKKAKEARETANKTYENTGIDVFSMEVDLGGGTSIVLSVFITKTSQVTVDSQGGEVAVAGIVPPPNIGVVVQVSGSEGVESVDITTAREVTKDIVEVALNENFDVGTALAIGAKESKLGIGGSVAGNNASWKKSSVNPLQLSAACKGCAPRAKSGDQNRRANIKGAMDVYKSFGGSLSNYGGESTGGTQKGYSDAVTSIYGSISHVNYLSTRCVSGC